MKMCFIGTDGSMGLTKGREYNLEPIKQPLFGERAPLWVEIVGPSIPQGMICPYSSFETFFQNWELVSKK